MTPNYDMAVAFVSALAGSPDAEMTWQLVNDDKCARHFAQIYHVSLKRIWGELCYQNARGVGVLAMVNSGDGRGRKTENVTGLRALFVDDDEGRLAPSASALVPLPPSFSVRSKRGFHPYWLVEPGEPLTAFTPAQVALITHFGTDPAVKDLPRVMRVPGFFHLKDPANPFMVTMVSSTGKRHTIDEVLAAYPPQKKSARPHEMLPAITPRRTRRAFAAAESEAASVLAAFWGLRVVRWAMEHPAAVTREAWRGLATNLAAAVLDHEELHEAAMALFRELSAPDIKRYSVAACDRTFRDALNSARNFGPMTFATLEEAGVPPEVCAGSALTKAPVGVARLLARRARDRPDRFAR